MLIRFLLFFITAYTDIFSYSGLTYGEGFIKLIDFADV